MAEPLRFKVLYQRVLKTGDYSTLRIGFEQEYYIGQKNPEEAFLEAGRLVNEVIMRRLGEENQTQVTVEQRPANPSVDPRENRYAEELERLPWQLYHEGHRAGWIFTDNAPSWLVQRIKQETFIYLAGFRYGLSGPQHQFISRQPVKEASA